MYGTIVKLLNRGAAVATLGYVHGESWPVAPGSGPHSVSSISDVGLADRRTTHDTWVWSAQEASVGFGAHTATTQPPIKSLTLNSLSLRPIGFTDPLIFDPLINVVYILSQSQTSSSHFNHV